MKTFKQFMEAYVPPGKRKNPPAFGENGVETKRIKRKIAAGNAWGWRGNKPNPNRRKVRNPNDPKVNEDGAACAGPAANAVGNGGVEGIGFGPKGEPGVNRKKKKSPVMIDPLRRKLTNPN